MNSSFPVAANVTDNFPTYTITVNDTNPIWVYCAQGAGTAASHCGKGMVFAVNCGADGTANSFTNFKDSALAVGAQLAANASASSAVAAPTTATIPLAASSDVASATESTAASSTAAASAATHTVVVGGNSSLTYSPSEVSAQPGDVVLFQLSVHSMVLRQLTIKLTYFQPIEEPHHHSERVPYPM